MGGQTDTVEAICARIAGRAKGIVERWELLGAGVTARQIERRIQKGALIPEFPGVYRVGHAAPSPEARYLAAVKACGQGAALSGRAAAWLWGLIKGVPPLPEVTSPRRRTVRGVKTRRCRGWGEGDLAECRGISVTSVARTLVDLAASLPLNELALACHEAGVKHRTTPRQVKAAMRRGMPGAAKLRRVLDGDAPALLSRLEERFYELVDRAELPRPIANKPAGSKRVDFRWEDPPLTVELDSYRFHHSPHAWEQDRRREREARARGDEFRRYTWSDVFEEPQAMIAELRQLLLGNRVR